MDTTFDPLFNPPSGTPLLDIIFSPTFEQHFWTQFLDTTLERRFNTFFDQHFFTPFLNALFGSNLLMQFLGVV